MFWHPKRTLVLIQTFSLLFRSRACSLMLYKRVCVSIHIYEQGIIFSLARLTFSALVYFHFPKRSVMQLQVMKSAENTSAFDNKVGAEVIKCV